MHSTLSQFDTRGDFEAPPSKIRYVALRQIEKLDMCVEKRGSRVCCIPVIEFRNATADFEALTISFAGSRYWLEGIVFSLVLILLSAEGEFVTRGDLIAMTGLPSGPSGTAQLSRLIRRVREKMTLRHQQHLLEVRREAVRIVA